MLSVRQQLPLTVTVHHLDRSLLLLVTSASDAQVRIQLNAVLLSPA